MRILQIGSDRSKRGVLFPDSPAMARQRAYAEQFGQLDIIGFSRRSDGAGNHSESHLNVHPTNSVSRFFYGFDAMRIAKRLPRPDVVSVQDPFEAGLVGWLIARRFNVPLHVQIHTDFLSPEYQLSSFLNRFRVRSGLTEFVLRRATRIRVVSERVRQGMLQSFPFLRTPISVLPIYVDAQAMKGPQEEQLVKKFKQYSTRVLFVGRLEPEKNPHLALLAFANAAPQDACLIVVGDGSQRPSLRSEATALGIQDRVFFEGAQDGRRYFPIANLVLVPSRYEGYGLVIVEALAAGKPVLSTDVGVAREVGATVSNENDFANELKQWFEHGPREGVLKSYPYKSFDDYVHAYCDDIAACVKK